jgi:formamidopyrimidine-DNA glycosylase
MEANMIDMVEARVIAGQIGATLLGKKIVAAELAEQKEKSMRDEHLLRVKPEEFRVGLEGRVLGAAYSKYRHVCIETDGEIGLDIWDVYGKILFILPGAKTPGHPPIALAFEDGSKLIVLPGVWGAMRLARNEELRAFRDTVDPTLLETASPEFTLPALQALLCREEFQKNTIKEVLVRYFPPTLVSVMGAYSQEALYRARVHPKRKVKALTEAELGALHKAIQEVTLEAIAAGGRSSERDLFDCPGGFFPSVSQASEGKPCPACGTPIEQVKLGGAGKYYICPGCQVL